MTPSDITERIKAIRSNYGLNQSEFSSKIGIKHHKLADIEKGKTKPSVEVISKIGDYFPISIEWLIYGEEKKSNASVQKMGFESADGLKVTVIENAGDDIAMIPQLNVNLAAGTGAYPPEHALGIGSRAFSLKWLQKKMLKPQNLRLVRVMGDSMHPLLHDKDLVMIELGRPPTSAMPVAFRFEKELYIKTYQPQGDGSIKMKSRNEAHDHIIINPKSPPEDYQIIGSVVWQSHSYI